MFLDDPKIILNVFKPYRQTFINCKNGSVQKVRCLYNKERYINLVKLKK